MPPSFSKVVIILLNWNGKKETLSCLESLQQLSYPNFEIVLVDNGSKDNSVEVISSCFQNITILETGENLGFAEGNNVGIRHALQQDARYLLLLNNDTTVDPGLIEGFLEGVDAGGDILGAKLYLHSKPDTFDHFGGNWNPKLAAFDLVGCREKEDGCSWEHPFEIDYACGCALFIKREVFEKTGFFDPRFFLIWEEADFCFRAKKQGFKVMISPQAKVWHKVSASFVGGGPHLAYFWWRNRFLWIERNCQKKERLALIFRIIFPELFHHLKLWILKSCRITFLTREKSKQRAQKQIKRKAALVGMRDYLLRRFGNGPSWLYTIREK